MSRAPSSLRAGSHPEKGIALVLVLWMLMLLTIVANSVSMTARTEAQVVTNLVQQARAEAAADAAIFKGIAALTAPADHPRRWSNNGVEFPWSYDGVDVRIRIRSEAAKIDLNTAPTVLLAGLFRAIGISARDADALADAIVDWRDQDNLRRLHGAEREDYAGAGKPYGPANALFETTEELQLVLGMNNEIFRAVADFVTVYSPSGSINGIVADRPVLLALPGTTPAQVDAYLERRNAALANGIPPPTFPPAPGSAGSTHDYYSIRAEAYSGDNAHFLREAVVRLTGNPEKPFVILAWHAPAPRPLFNGNPSAS